MMGKLEIEGLFNEDLAAKPGALGINQPATIEFGRPVPASQPYTQPYWLAKTPTAGQLATP